MAPPTVFVYGTLAAPSRADAVLDDWRDDGPAVLDGCRRVEGRYPTLAPGGETPGRLLVTPELDKLDAYEGVDDGLYVRVAVPVVGDEGVADRIVRSAGQPGAGGAEAWVYVGDPDRLDASAAWPGVGPFEPRVRREIRRRGVVVRRATTR
ncbi:MAG: gamma-glutamylcyclotransferase family protein [Halobacteriales archaeon]